MEWIFPSVNKGVVSSKIIANLFGDPAKTYMVNAFINPGNSGGPLFSLEDGKAIGIINSKINLAPQNLYLPNVNMPAGMDANFGGISLRDLISVTIDNRNIMLELIGKNGQAGIGFSVSTDYIEDYK